MDFGRITDPAKLSSIQWNLPDLDSEEEKLQLKRLQRAGNKIKEMQPNIFVGTPVWAESKWVGRLFPIGTAPDSFLKEFAKQFSMVEVNSTFYTMPGPETFLKWATSVNSNFRFCPKFPQSISRPLAIGLELKDLEPFVERIRLLNENLGVSFLQLPPDVGMESWGRLQTLFSKIPRDLKTVVEFRHSSFFVNRRLRPEVVNLLASHHLGTVITDTALYREFAHASLSSTRVMLRFAASDLHPTDYPRMEQWVERLKLWYKNGIKEVYVSVHAKDPWAEISAARFFIQKLNESLKEVLLFESISEPVFYHELQGTLF